MKNLEEALNAYYEHFGENYPLCITGGQSNEEIIENIELCIDRNETTEPPEYDEDADY